MDDLILSDNEISLLDIALTEISQQKPFRAVSGYRQPWSKLSSLPVEGANEVLEALRLKGIFNIKTVTELSSKFEDESEVVFDETYDIGQIDPHELVKCWLVTVYLRAGKELTSVDLNKLTPNGSQYVFPVQVGSDTASVKLIVTDDDEISYTAGTPGTLYVSFIGDLPVHDKYYIHWYNCLTEVSSASRFFTWITEESKPVLSKQYVYINIPSDLEKPERESAIEAVVKYIEKIGFERSNEPEAQRPESIDYFFPEGVIRECFVSKAHDRKIFLVVSGDTIHFHTFRMGQKSPDPEITYHARCLQDWVEKKARAYRKITRHTKSSLTSELLKQVPILAALALSAFTSLRLLWKGNVVLQNLPTSQFWISTHIVLSLIVIVGLMVVGLVPHISAWVYSWNRGIVRFANKNVNKLRSLKP